MNSFFLFFFLIFRRLDLIFLDITKNILRKLGKESIPSSILPSIHPGKIYLNNLIFFNINLLNIIEEKLKDESIIPINSVANCIQVLTECYDTINAQESLTFVIFYYKE